jgi:hypothetical protein
VPRFQKIVSDNSELRLTTSTQKGNEMELHMIDVMDVTEAIRSPTWTQFFATALEQATQLSNLVTSATSDRFSNELGQRQAYQENPHDVTR